MSEKFDWNIGVSFLQCFSRRPEVQPAFYPNYTECSKSLCAPYDCIVIVRCTEILFITLYLGTFRRG